MKSIITKYFKNLFKTKFIQHVMLLTGGTAIAQMLMILALPLLTRLYTPTDYSILAIYASILGVISAIACMRLEIAIPIADNEGDVINLLILSFISVTILSILGALIVFLFSTEITILIEQPKIKPYLWFLPIGLWLSGIYSVLQFWATRKEKFPIIAKTRITQACGSISSQIGFGIAGLAPVGLLIGQLINSSAGITLLMRELIKYKAQSFKSVNYHSLINTLRKYKQYPQYSMIEALCNNAGIQVPILMIAALAIGPEVGFLALATRIMAAPLQLLGGAIRQVYLSKAPSEFRQGTLAIFTTRVLTGLVKTGVGPIVFVGIIAPIIFPLVFGEQWQRAGEIVRWMTPWFVLQFLASPLSMALHVANHQQSALLLQILGLAIRVASVLFAFRISPIYIVEAYALSSFAFYAIYLYLIIKTCSLSLEQFLSTFTSSLKVIFLWIIFGAVISFGIRYFTFN
ncbi:oligosaccharide flippase family protein [Alcaligenaceae bacterium]|nr:oligosaccharide flippase family protein [Alcaligenaceae bacterium]